MIRALLTLSLAAVAPSAAPLPLPLRRAAGARRAGAAGYA